MNAEEAKALIDDLSEIDPQFDFQVVVSRPVIVVEPEPAPEPEQEPEEPVNPPSAVLYQVVEDKAVVRVASKTNAKDYPIMVIYVDPMGGRERYETGDTVSVYPELVRADGGEYYYKMVRKGAYGESLFVRMVDGKLI